MLNDTPQPHAVYRRWIIIHRKVDLSASRQNKLKLPSGQWHRLNTPRIRRYVKVQRPRVRVLLVVWELQGLRIYYIYIANLFFCCLGWRLGVHHGSRSAVALASRIGESGRRITQLALCACDPSVRKPFCLCKSSRGGTERRL